MRNDGMENSMKMKFMTVQISIINKVDVCLLKWWNFSLRGLPVCICFSRKKKFKFNISIITMRAKANRIYTPFMKRLLNRFWKMIILPLNNYMLSSLWLVVCLFLHLLERNSVRKYFTAYKRKFKQHFLQNKN